MPTGQHCHRPSEYRFPCPCSPHPPVGPADPNGPLMLAAHAELCRGEQAVDDVVVLPHAIIDELTVTFGSDDEQRRRLSFSDSTGHLDINLRTIVERRDRTPGRIVAFDRITEPQSRDIHTGHNG